MKQNRTARLNSLLKEVISEVITKEVRNPDVAKLSTVTSVEITPDLRHAKVFISVIGTIEEKEKTIKALQKAAGFIAISTSKKVVMRYFPALTFKLDTTVDAHMKIDKILEDLKKNEPKRD